MAPEVVTQLSLALQADMMYEAMSGTSREREAAQHLLL
jgi:hypothetical protein